MKSLKNVEMRTKARADPFTVGVNVKIQITSTYPQSEKFGRNRILDSIALCLGIGPLLQKLTKEVLSFGLLSEVFVINLTACVKC